MYKHFLVVAPALVGAPGDNHIRHHLVNLHELPQVPILEQFAEVLQEKSVSQLLFLIPVAFPSRVASALLFSHFYEEGQSDISTEGCPDVLHGVWSGFLKFYHSIIRRNRKRWNFTPKQ